MSLQDITAQLEALSSAEKAELLRRLALELTHGWPGIEKLSGVAGGEACIAHTRIPVWVLEGYRRLNWSEAKILENYPTIHASDLVAAWAYADAHQGEIENAIRKNEQAEMVRLYANENFPRQVVEALRALGHDVLTVAEAGNAGQGVPDAEVLAFATREGRVLLTLNRWDFIQLHAQSQSHAGIVVCTQDPDAAG